VGNKPEEFDAFLADEVRRWHPLIKALDLKLE
jgi:tripartite-type tricarboxylate transporter receptor subunit TctC